jgi:8-oxo-dGTP diphosphatase
MRPREGRAGLAAPECDQIRVRVAAVIVLDGHLVLVRHRKNENSYHLLPGGGVEAGETLEAALVREVAEETGLEVSVSRLLFINDSVDPRGGRHVLNVTFLASIKGGEITLQPLDPRVEAVELVAPATLPDLDLRPPIAGALVDAFEKDFSIGTRYLGSLWVYEREVPDGTAPKSTSG